MSPGRRPRVSLLSNESDPRIFTDPQGSINVLIPPLPSFRKDPPCSGGSPGGTHTDRLVTHHDLVSRPIFVSGVSTLLGLEPRDDKSNSSKTLVSSRYHQKLSLVYVSLIAQCFGVKDRPQTSRNKLVDPSSEKLYRLPRRED